MSNVAEVVTDEPKPAEPAKDLAEGFEDLDAKELADARAAADAEEQADNAAPGDKEGDDAAKPEETAKAAPEDKEDLPKQIMIPKERLDEALGRTRDLENQVAYYRGQADANTRKGEAPADKGQVAPEPTPTERIAEIRQQKIEIARKFDSGDLSFEEAETQRQTLDDKEWDVRQTTLKPAERQETARQTGDSLVLEERTNDLVKAHPYLDRIGSPAESPTAALRWEGLYQEARIALADEGITIPPGTRADHHGNLSDAVEYRVRQKMAELTDRYGPVWFSEQQPASPKPSGKDGLSDTAAARKAALDRADKAPPDISQIGGQGDRTEVSEADVNRMSEDEFLALPASVRRKFDPAYG